MGGSVWRIGVQVFEIYQYDGFANVRIGETDAAGVAGVAVDCHSFCPEFVQVRVSHIKQRLKPGGC